MRQGRKKEAREGPRRPGGLGSQKKESKSSRGNRGAGEKPKEDKEAREPRVAGKRPAPRKPKERAARGCLGASRNLGSYEDMHLSKAEMRDLDEMARVQDELKRTRHKLQLGVMWVQKFHRTPSTQGSQGNLGVAQGPTKGFQRPSFCAESLAGICQALMHQFHATWR